jgi:1-phosphatidylinositol-4-phosphate 5-kinase
LASLLPRQDAVVDASAPPAYGSMDATSPLEAPLLGAGGAAPAAAASSSSKAPPARAPPRLEPPPLELHDLAPPVFARVRASMGVRPLAFLKAFRSFCGERFSEGASGAFMFFTGGREFLVKTLSAREAETLERVVLRYAAYLQANPASLLVRFVACHRLRLYRQVLHFVVMQNILRERVDQTFDLKGSWVNRSGLARARAKPDSGVPRRRPSARGPNVRQPQRAGVLLDNDLNFPLRLPVDTASSLAGQLARDAEFLASLGIMDYSLLVGVHRELLPLRLLASVPLSPSAGPLSPRADAATSAELLVPAAPAWSDGSAGGSLSVLVPACVEGPARYHFGVIDILQEWTWAKRLERWAKTVLRCQARDGISALPPGPYAARFRRRVVDAVVLGHGDGADGEDDGVVS